jgi:ActR/RegA family two-component response regulator
MESYLSTPANPVSDRPDAGHVLVIEDDPSWRDALCRIARRLGYRADCEATVRGALAKLAERPTCVILDLRLSDGSGLAVLEYIRTMGLTMRVAVVTGAADGDLLADAVLMHPDAMFTKPVDITEIAGWLKRRATPGNDVVQMPAASPADGTGTSSANS